MKLFIFFSISLFSLVGNVFSQQLIINEISQGTGAQEYVEFVIIGSPTCQTPVPCLDLRGVVLDDNNGYFSVSASGSGIASGAIRFGNNAIWSCVSQGTIIVIYNESDINPNLPPDDVSMTDGNCRLILPANSILLEGQSTSPSSANPNFYPTSGWVAGAGSWGQVAMSNSNDSFQIRANANSSTPSHAVSWGNNTLNAILYFSSAGSSVFSLTNNTGINPNVQSNWTLGSVGVDETPGLGNNAANSMWISSMNPQCGVGSPSLQVTLSQTNESCPSACDGTITSSVSNGVAPFTYSWTNASNTANIVGLCPDTYVLQVTDQNGCTASASATILAGTAAGDPTIQAVSQMSTSDLPIQLLTMTAGGVWTSNCGSCLNNSGIFSPSLSGSGVYEICYTLGTGNCSTSDCINIDVTNCTPETTVENLSICPETTTLIFGQQIGTPGTYSQMNSNVNGCDSTHVVNLNIYSVYPVNTSYTLCQGDSIEVFGTWVYEDYIGEEFMYDINSCPVKNTTTIISENCDIEEFNLFIPNVFTPNNDGVNDFFKVELVGGYLNEGYILNRWGEIIANFDNNNKIWNGKSIHGEAVADGVYTYLIYYTPINQSRLKAQGFVTVMQ
ncbi:MAG: gliding motility-associated C-terminal domain-containing protein [Bacteroidota bacterium]